MWREQHAPTTSGSSAGLMKMTWRLVNAGKTERWHEANGFTMYPGENGRGNHCGPHDGLLVSSRAQGGRKKRIMPYVEHPAIAAARTATRQTQQKLTKEISKCVQEAYLHAWLFPNRHN